MKIGKLYQFKEYGWYMYPSKEIANIAGTTRVLWYTDLGDSRRRRLSSLFNCEVICVGPRSMFVLLGYEANYWNILTADGQFGWISFFDWCMEHVEEVNQ